MSNPPAKRTASQAPLSSPPILPSRGPPAGGSSQGSSRPGSSHGQQLVLPPPGQASNNPIALSSSPFKSAPWSEGAGSSAAAYSQTGHSQSSQLSVGNVPTAWAQATKEQKSDIKKDQWDLGLNQELSDYVRKLATEGSPSGYCRLTKLVPTKQDGYVQISLVGLNKMMTLGDALLILGGRWQYKGTGMQASHLCDQPRCTVADHVIPESTTMNNSRKNCGGVMRCPCGNRGWLVVCEHRPMCIPSFKLTDPWGNDLLGDWRTVLRDVNICHHLIVNNQGIRTYAPGKPLNLA